MQMLKFLAPLVGFASLALAGNGTTTTVVVSEFVTYCPEPTILVFKNKTITVTEATTLTITGTFRVLPPSSFEHWLTFQDCPCTIECYTPPPVTLTSSCTPVVPYANKPTTPPPVIITSTPAPVTSLQSVTHLTTAVPATTVTTKPPVVVTTKPPVVVTTETPAVVPTGTGPAQVVTAGANKVTGAAAIGLVVGMAALVL